MPLLRLYVELGLHTNTEAVTDKNSQRYAIMIVLRKLWEQPVVWARLHTLATGSVGVGGGAGGDGADFGAFVGTLVKENIFLLDDALGRLSDVKKRQEEVADEEVWKAQPKHTRLEREARLEQVRYKDT